MRTAASSESIREQAAAPKFFASNNGYTAESMHRKRLTMDA
jgi:hypothetical protein